MRLSNLVCVVLLCIVSASFSVVHISPEDPNIQFTGVVEKESSAQGMMLYRLKKSYIHDPAADVWGMKQAGCQTGITINIKTKSPTVKFKFALNSTYEDRFANVYLYKNGADTYKNTWGGKGQSLSPGDSVSTDTALAIWTCILPPFKAQYFEGIELADGFSLLPMEEKSKPVYVAIGNSITHGTGNEGATRNTYPWKIAKALNYELYNFAVGASGINTKVLDNLDGLNPDLITVLWGYNDRNRLNQAMPRFDTLITRLVTEHPTSVITVIGQTYTTTTTNIAELRNRELEIVEKLQEQHDNLFYIAGDSYTEWEDVKVDGIHLTPDGATSLATGLISELRPILGEEISVNLDTVITTKYSVSGSKIKDENGKEVRFVGVNRPSLEWSSTGRLLNESDIENIAKTGSNIVRLPLNEIFWLHNKNNYQERIDTVVYWCMKHGMNIILDNHRSLRGDSLDVNKGGEVGVGEIYGHADTFALDFLYKLGLKYKDNGKVLFELYNEPHKITWEEIVNGGTHDNDTPNDPTDDWTMIGYQQLYDTLRASGAENLVIIGGNNWSFDLSYYETNPIAGDNIMYATHCYPFDNKQPEHWYQWTEIARNYPVIMSEFGPGSKNDMAYVEELSDTMDALGVHWTAWAWYTFNANNMWESFYPEMNLYDTTDFGAWIVKTIEEKSKVAINDKSSLAGAVNSNTPFLVSGNRLLLHSAAPYKMEIFTANGRRVHSAFSSDKVVNLQKLGLATGVYQLQVHMGNQIFTDKIHLK